METDIRAIPGRTLHCGRASMPWHDDAEGWALPGGDVVSVRNTLRAIAIVQRMDAMISENLKTASARTAWATFRPTVRVAA